MLAYARSRSLPNAPIARTIICIRSSKLHFSSAAAFAFFSRARRRALGGAGFALGTPVERSRGSLVGRTGIVPPGRWGRSGLLLRRVGLRRSSVGELRSAAGAPFASLRTPENHKIIRSAFVSRDRSLVTTEAFKLLQALSQWNLAQCSLSRIDALAARGDLLLPNSQHEQTIKVRINFQTINKKN